MSRLPDFLVLGAQRAGTTWLYQALREHPQVFLPEPKELHFFTARFADGVEWYAKHFSAAAETQVVGEITPTYMYFEHAVNRIAQILPGVRALVVLREPIARARSAYQLLRRDKMSQYRSFEEALTAEAYLRNLSRYAEPVERLLALFGPDHVKVMLYDDLQSNPRAFLVEVFQFIGVDPTFRPPALAQRYNQAVLPGLQHVLVSARMGRPLEWFKRSRVGGFTKRAVAGMSRSLRAHETRMLRPPPELRELFLADVHDLERLIGRDLSRWRMVLEEPHRDSL